MSKEQYKTYLRQRLSLLPRTTEKSKASVQNPDLVDWLAENQGRKFPHLNGDPDASKAHIEQILNRHPVMHTPATAVAAIHPYVIEGNPRVEEDIYHYSPEEVIDGAPSKGVVLANEAQHAYDLETDLKEYLSKLKGK